jgi:hypothetical protein
MLNTWAGPGWVPTNTISNVLVAIQALVLNEEPLRNEPGFETADRKELLKYNEVLHYANIKISVLEMMQNQPKYFEVFKEKMNHIFMKNIEYYRNFTLQKNDEYQNKKDKQRIIESPAYNMKLSVDYETLMYEIEKMNEDLYIKYTINLSDLNITDKENKEDEK